jgi:hypothetical protein
MLPASFRAGPALGARFLNPFRAGMIWWKASVSGPTTLRNFLLDSGAGGSK